MCWTRHLFIVRCTGVFKAHIEELYHQQEEEGISKYGTYAQVNSIIESTQHQMAHDHEFSGRKLDIVREITKPSRKMGVTLYMDRTHKIYTGIGMLVLVVAFLITLWKMNLGGEAFYNWDRVENIIWVAGATLVMIGQYKKRKKSNRPR